MVKLYKRALRQSIVRYNEYNNYVYDVTVAIFSPLGEVYLPCYRFCGIGSKVRPFFHECSCLRFERLTILTES